MVEHWNPHARIRQDLFGFIDIIAIDGDDTLAIQATSTGNINSRVEKILANDIARDWLDGPHRRIIVIGWKKYKKAIDRKHWRPTFREITRRDFEQN